MHFFLRQNLFEPLELIDIVGHTATTGQFQWTTGIRFDRPVPRETLLLDTTYGTTFPEFFDTTIPIMSQPLIEELYKIGIDNFDSYPMLLKRQNSDEEIDGYSAINLIGCVDAVDLANSVFRLRLGKPRFTGPITIDPMKCQDLDAFRLIRGPGFIVLSERCAELLRPRLTRAVLLQATTEYSGT